MFAIKDRVEALWRPDGRWNDGYVAELSDHKICVVFHDGMSRMLYPHQVDSILSLFLSQGWIECQYNIPFTSGKKHVKFSVQGVYLSDPQC